MAGKFEPKTPVQLNPPKDDPISADDLAQADGTSHLVPQLMPSHRVFLSGTRTDVLLGVDGNKCYVAIKVGFMHTPLLYSDSGSQFSRARCTM